MAARQRKEAPPPAPKKKEGRALARPEDLKAELRRYAVDDAARAPTGGGEKLSIKGKRFALRGSVLESPLDVVVLDYSFENAYYDSDYDSDNPSPPACFAVGKHEKELAPHPDSPKPQAERCRDCWANAWASAEKGRGKACKNSIRAALLEAGVKRFDADHVQGAEAAFITLPPTSLRHFTGHIKKLAGMELPMFSVVTQLDFDEDAEHPVVTFQYNGEVDDAKTLRALVDKRETVQEGLEQGFDCSGYVDPEEKPQKKRPAAKAGREAPAKKGAGPAPRKSKF